MSLKEVQQGQAQSLLKKKPELSPEPQKKHTPVFTPEYYEMTPEEKGLYEAEHDIHYVQHRGFDYSSLYKKQQTLMTSTGGHIPITVKEGINTHQWKSKIPEWKFGPAQHEAIQPAVKYYAYKKAVQEVRNAPPGTIISKTEPVVHRKFFEKNVWQHTFEQAQQMFNPVEKNIMEDESVDKRFEQWKKLPLSIRQQVIQGSMGTFDNPFGIYTWKYYFSGKNGEKQIFKEIYDPYMQKLKTKFESPVGATEFMMLETIPGAYYGFKGFSKGLGYLKGLSPTGAQISKGISRTVGTYFAEETIKGLSEATKQGPETLSKYIVSTGAMLSVGMFGMRSFKSGELAGMRKRFYASLKTPEERARADILFKSIDFSKNISSKNLNPLDLSTVENLRGRMDQQIALRNALMSKEMKPYKVVLGGSAAGFEMSPHDLDIYVAKSIFRRGFFKDVSSSESLLKKIGFEKTSNVDVVKNIFKKYNVDSGLFDIHDLPTKGEPFPQLGTGFAEKPVRTAPGSLFKWQVSLSEQAGRKLASAWAPLHEYRGKDWNTVLQIAKERFKPALYEELVKMKPETIGDKFTGPSYYQTHPMETPKKQFTWFERQLRKYGKPLSSQDLFTSEAWKQFAKPDAELYRPKFVEKTMIDPRAKGVIFWSGGYPLYEGGSKSRFPLALPIPYPKSNFPSEKQISYPPSPDTRYSPFTQKIIPRAYPSIEENRYTSPFIENKKYAPSPVPSSSPHIPHPIEKYPLSPISYGKEIIHKTELKKKRPPIEDIFLKSSKKKKRTIHTLEYMGWLEELPIPTLKDLFGG